MSGPMRPTYTDEQALSDTWDAIAAYEQQVDALIGDAVDKKPGYIDSMTYDAGKRKLTTDLRTLSATYDADKDHHIKEVGFSRSDQTQTHGQCGKHREIKEIKSLPSDEKVTLVLTFANHSTEKQTVVFNVAKGPQGKPGEDEKWPASGEVKKSGGTATKYGKNGEKVAEASSAFATGSATGVSASISVASFSVTGVSLSVTGLSLSWDGIFSGYAVDGGDHTVATRKHDVVNYEVSMTDFGVVTLMKKAKALETELESVTSRNVGISTNQSSFSKD